MREDAGNSFIQRFVLGQALWEPPPKRDKRAEHALAVFVTGYLSVPELLATDVEQGFLLLTDFGDRQLLQELTPETVDH